MVDWQCHIFVIFFKGDFTNFLANVIRLPVLLDLDTCNASASDNSTVFFPKSDDSAGRGNGLDTMMNTTLPYHSGPGWCTARSH